MANNHDWRLSFGISAVGVVGALLGTALQYGLTVRRERTNAFEQKQNDAYLAFLNAFDKSRMAKREADSAKAAQFAREYELEAGIAARRIALFGNKQVVEAMAEWYRHQGTQLPPCNEDDKIELAIWLSMRGGLAKVDSADLAAVAGRCRLAGNP